MSRVSGVAPRRQCRCLAVVQSSRRGPAALGLALLALVGLAPSEALAAPRASGDTGAAQGGAPSQAQSYATALALGYTLAPLLAIPVGAGLFELSRNDAVSVVGAGLAVVAVPFTIHSVNGAAGRGAMSALLSPVVTLGAAAIGGVIGGAIGTSGCDNDSDCELAGGMSGVIAGALLGGLTGYVSYAVYDVTTNSAIDALAPRQSGVALWALPVMARAEEHPAPLVARVRGALVGASLAF